MERNPKNPWKRDRDPIWGYITGREAKNERIGYLSKSPRRASIKPME